MPIINNTLFNQNQPIRGLVDPNQPTPLTPLPGGGYSITGPIGISPRPRAQAGGVLSTTPITTPKPATATPTPQTGTPAGATSALDYNANPYFLRPGETPDQYNQRIGQSRTTTPATATTPVVPPSTAQTIPQTTPSVAFPGIVSGLGQMAAAPSQQYTQAQQDYSQAANELQDLRTQAAQQGFQIGESRTNLAEAGGEQGLLQNLIANKESALAGRMSAAMAQASAATAQQQTQQAGLTQAGGLAAPTPAQALGFYQPLTGQVNQFPGGPFAGGQALGNVQLGQQFQTAIAPAYNASAGILQGMNNFLQQNPNLNPSDFNLFNYANAWIRGQQLSDPNYPKMSQYINEFLNTLTNIVGSPGMSTNYKQQIVNDMVNSTSKTGSLQDQMQNLLGIALQKAQSIYGTGQQASTPTNLGTPQVTGQPTGGTVFSQNWF